MNVLENVRARGTQLPVVRRGLVLGGGGTLGAAWMIGALRAIEQRTGFDPRGAQLIVGTSAGSILAALLGAGASADDLWQHQRGEQVAEGPLAGHIFNYDLAAGGAAPPMPIPGWFGSPRLIARSVRHPRRYPGTAVISAFLPPGRGSLGDIGQMVEDVIPSGTWSPHPGIRIVAMDYDSGERVVFGRAGAPPIGLAEAVVASCSIPGWFPPARLGERRFVDGGTVSNTNLDVLAADEMPGGRALDEIYVLAPSAARGYDKPSGVLGRLERSFRHLVTRQMLHEVIQARREGTKVHVLCPGPEDLEVIGANLMDPSRRVEVLDTALRTAAAGLAAEQEPQPQTAVAPRSPAR
ncbi:patatin-like phospholipase family protein [Actinospica sp.]|uniref:patatin-like phospholipase family protein n=1 Tax=Actinospica sp. TaxID=1872142 RepID=UPI002BCE39ED|nr:patatin-like phospholipase family protein [Actinospica sp.]HWG27872.1 patatin-like phospholipase family protein [Actinospica sp.]